jgi:hypothetical protein
LELKPLETAFDKVPRHELSIILFFSAFCDSFDRRYIETLYGRYLISGAYFYTQLLCLTSQSIRFVPCVSSSDVQRRLPGANSAKFEEETGEVRSQWALEAVSSCARCEASKVGLSGILRTVILYSVTG